MRVLHVIPSLTGRDGGPGKAVVQMCRELQQRGHHPLIYTTNADGAECLSVPIGRVTEIEGTATVYFQVNGGHYYKVSWSLASAVRQNVSGFDMVHVHALYQFPSTVAAYCCRRRSVPYIVQPHGSLDPYLFRRHPVRKRVYEMAVERRNLRSASAVLFTSKEEMTLARSLGLRFRGAVMPLGVQIEERESGLREVADRLWPELAGKKVMLFLGRIHPVKAMDVLARAFGDIHREHLDVRLVIAGPATDDYAARLRQWLAAEKALEATVFTGMVEDERKAALLERADVLVLPSYTESFGLAAAEAMAAGVPVVVSNRVKIWREIDGAGAGLIVNPEAKELAKATLALLRDKPMARYMGAQGARLARDRFSWSVAGDRLVRLYEEVISSRFPTPPLATTEDLTAHSTV